ncbi:Curved DNA-binding protein [uncultured delta proteobacterium]|uniref:Curved DNA-binding protein n=1 Tax=uncultured delta proteobacterium TaxID=34034 RepID=A0A212IU15_9DELT|nr:Curved DNA-binding protein [uncultured delta proteobacterium]
MAVEYKDYYKLLGVSKTATKDEISKAFKKLARKYHPDFNQGDKEAEGTFKDINEAYEVLKDAEKRKLYDTLGPDWQNAQHFQNQGGGFSGTPFGGGGFSGSFNGQNFNASGFSDFFETLFGGGRAAGNFGGGFGGGFGADPFASYGARSRKGRDIDVTIQLTLEDAYHGGAKSISLQGGSGQVRNLEVKIPAGVKNGARIRLAGQGEPGSGKDAKPGDLFLHVALLPHPMFSLDDNDVVYELAVAPWEAALGAKVRVPTLDGNIELTIPAGSGSSKKFRLRGKGLGAGTGKGDQFVRLAIAMPPSLTDEEKLLWEQLRDISSFTPR